MEPGELTVNDILYLTYEYFKDQAIQRINGKYTLFNYDKDTIGYMLMNKDEYYDLNHNVIVDL